MCAESLARGVSRRAFLAAPAAAGALCRATSAADPPAYEVIDQDVARGQTRRLKLLCGGRMLAAILFPTDYPTHFRLKPVLSPLCTPGGLPVTESQPYCFVHQQAVSTGHGKVRAAGSAQAVDFYRHLPFPDGDRADRWHRDFNLFRLGPSGIQRVVRASWGGGPSIVVDLEICWETRLPGQERGVALLVEQRRYEVAVRGQATIVDQFSRLRAADGPVTLAADRHSLAGVRVNDLIDVEDGGLMQDSEGRTNPGGYYCDPAGDRRAPRWVDCSGQLGGQAIGATLMGHPANLRNQFYVREYGLMTVSAMLTQDVELREAQSWPFAVRFVAHDGPLDRRVAEGWYTDFARPVPPPA